MNNSPHTGRAVIVLGDHDTGQRAEMLTGTAAEHQVSIAEVHTFAPGEAGPCDDLTQIEAVVTALARALALQADIWVPFWREDLAREEHVRRLGLVLRRYGRNLVLGQNLWAFPPDGGFNDIDVALRREVRAVDDLDHAALAAAALPNLSGEIEYALHTAANRAAPPPTEHASAFPVAARAGHQAAEILQHIEADFGPCPPLPPTTAPWPQRRPDLKRFARWLVNDCGLTQTDTANLLNTAGHRTAHGRPWQRSTVSALVNGRYDRRTAA